MRFTIFRMCLGRLFRYQNLVIFYVLILFQACELPRGIDTTGDQMSDYPDCTGSTLIWDKEKICTGPFEYRKSCTEQNEYCGEDRPEGCTDGRPSCDSTNHKCKTIRECVHPTGQFYKKSEAEWVYSAKTCPGFENECEPCPPGARDECVNGCWRPRCPDTEKAHRICQERRNNLARRHLAEIQASEGDMGVWKEKRAQYSTKSYDLSQGVNNKKLYYCSRMSNVPHLEDSANRSYCGCEEYENATCILPPTLCKQESPILVFKSEEEI